MKPKKFLTTRFHFFSKKVLGILLFLFIGYLFLWFNFSSKTLPNTYLGSVNVGGRDISALPQTISDSLDAMTVLTFHSSLGETVVSMSEAGISFDKEATVKLITETSQDKSIFNTLGFLTSQFKFKHVKPVFLVDQGLFETFISSKLGGLRIEAIDASVSNLNGKVVITNEKEGQQIDRSQLIKDIKSRLFALSKEAVEIRTITKKPLIYASDLQKAALKLERLNTQTFVLTFGYDNWTLKGNELSAMLKTGISNLDRGYILAVNIGSGLRFGDVSFEGLDQMRADIFLDNVKFDKYLESISSIVNRPRVDATLKFENGRVQQFTPAVDGQDLDRVALKQAIDTKVSINDISSESTYRINLPVNVTRAKVANEQINALGIRELIGKGVSYFSGSIPNRAYNVQLGASRINGTLVAPGEVFSFNSSVGEVSGKTGYKQAYVINAGRTVLDDGGGICQVSTTIYRAALNTGLPIVSRTGHAYRVGYYEQHGFKPGLDATVFSPSVDFQFKNDTGHHILVQSVYDAINARLEIDFYGTLDGRKVEITDPVIVSQTPPLPEKRQDDPSLPKGTVKQVDFPAWGAQVFFKRKVTSGDKLLIDETVRTNYRPWAAVYLVGTGS